MKFVLDTNVHIYFNLFTDCDWKTLLENDDLTLLVTPTILGEIDKLKNDP
jgi:predicted nucleic acid-binding protein